MAGNPGISGFDPMVLTNNALVVTVQGGQFIAGGSTGIVSLPATNLTLTASTTSYVYLQPSTATVTFNTTGFPAYSFPIAVVTTGASIITGIQDVRTAWAVEAGAMFVTSTPAVLTTCNSTVQNVATYALPAGFLNTAGKTIRFKSYGILNTSSASGLQLGLQLSTTNVCLVNTANITTSLTNQPWLTEMTLTVANAGATGNIEGHGYIGAQLTAAGAATATSVTQDVQTAVSSNINLTNPLTLGFVALTNGAIVNFTARMATLEILN